jgi:membrane protease YdiL (CAAX protease family)
MAAKETCVNVPDDYWRAAKRPLASLLFVAPLLVFYEVGVLVLGPQAMRNAADVWLRALLDWLGFGSYFLLPALTCAALLAWHYATRQPWHVRSRVLYGMLVESLVFGFALLLIASCQQSLFRALLPASAGQAGETGGVWALLVGYIGAGIYEELLFRLMLLPATLGFYRLIGMTPRVSIVFAIVTTSLLFSAAHYQFDVVLAGYPFRTVYGEAFEWSSFTFRFAAGALFSLLFLYRGFGIAVGSHALYDLFTLLS